MATKGESDERLQEAINSLPVHLQSVFEQLRIDYADAAQRLVPRFKGGLAAQVAAELVRLGWRKSDGEDTESVEWYADLKSPDVMKRLKKQFPSAKMEVVPDPFGTRTFALKVDSKHLEDVRGWERNI